MAANKKKIKLKFKSKERKAWSIYQSNEALLHDWADLFRNAIHRQNLFKNGKFLLLKVEWHQQKGKLHSHDEVNRESDRFREEKEQALNERGYNI